MIIILMGKSASGKDTVKNELISRGCTPIISATTRKPRTGEKNGVDYWFVSKDQFLDMLTSGEVFEYRRFDAAEGSTYFGARKITLDKDRDYVVVLDPGGAEEFRKAYGNENCKVFYINTQDHFRKNRAQSRGDFDEKAWNIRLKDEEERFSESRINFVADYTVSNDEELGITKLADEIVNLTHIKKARVKVWCQAYYTEEVPVPEGLEGDELREYIMERLAEMPFTGVLNYLPGSDELDPEDEIEIV